MAGDCRKDVQITLLFRIAEALGTANEPSTNYDGFVTAVLQAHEEVLVRATASIVPLIPIPLVKPFNLQL